MNVADTPLQNLAESGTITPFPRRKVAQEGGAELTQEQRRTLRLKDSLPRGITLGHRTDGREKPFSVRFGPNRTTESFTSEKVRNDRAQELAKGVAEEGSGVLDFDPVKWRRLKQFEVATGMTLEQAEQVVLRVRGNLRLNLTVEASVANYKALRDTEGLSDDGHTDLHLDRFVAMFKHPFTLFAVTPDNIRAWMTWLKPTYALGPVSLRHHRKTVYAFFERAIVEKWTMENPTKAVKPPKVDAVDTTVLGAKDAFHLLKANRDQPVVGRIALELYGFMRCSSVERIVEAHVKWESKGLEMKGTHTDEETGEKRQGHKSGKRKFRQGQPPVLWEWLKHATPKMWEDITEKNYDEKKADAFTRARVANPGNVLRHSCASYVLAVTKNMPFVSYMMQHTSLKMTERYEGVAEEHAGKLVLAMTPAAVLLTWEEFQVRWAEFYTPITPKTFS